MIMAPVDAAHALSVRAYAGTGCGEGELACLGSPGSAVAFLGKAGVRYKFLVSNYARGANAKAALNFEIRDY